MSTSPASNDKWTEQGDRSDDGYEVWLLDKIQHGLDQADAGKLIPADEVWRRLGLER